MWKIKDLRFLADCQMEKVKKYMNEEQKVWAYTRGMWEQVIDPFQFPDGTDWDNEIRKLGYSRQTSEREYEPYCSIWRQGSGTPQPWPYLVWFSLSGDGADFILIRDLPSLLMFMQSYGAVMQTLRLDSVLDVLPKFFYAWHGHYMDEDCMECDPVEVDARRARLAERRAKQQAKQAATANAH